MSEINWHNGETIEPMRRDGMESEIVDYYMENMLEECGTIREALEYLFSDCDDSDILRAMDSIRGNK